VRLARVDFPFTEPPAVPIIGVAYADLAGAIGDALARCVVAAIRAEDLDDLPALSLPPAIEAFYLAELRNRLGSAKAHALREAELFGHLLGKVSP
jgi:hypothetical protein